MKTIGLLGGMSWESTQIYYHVINRAVQDALGGVASARLVLHSVNFAEYNARLQAGDWDGIAAALGAAGQGLKAAGADFLMIGTNTMHKVADRVAAAAGLPLLHICDCTAEAVLAAGVKKVGLLGTAYTMEQAFYRERLAARGLEVLTPEADDRAILQKIIFDELCCGIVSPEAQAHGRAILAKLADAGAQGAILGCTELPLLIAPEDSALPLFDTTEIHALAASRLALAV